MLKVKAHQVVYGLTRVEKCEKLQEFGQLLSRLQATYTDKDSGHYGLMRACYGGSIYRFIVLQTGASEAS